MIGERRKDFDRLWDRGFAEGVMQGRLERGGGVLTESERRKAFDRLWEQVEGLADHAQALSQDSLSSSLDTSPNSVERIGWELAELGSVVEHCLRMLRPLVDAALTDVEPVWRGARKACDMIVKALDSGGWVSRAQMMAEAAEESADVVAALKWALPGPAAGDRVENLVLRAGAHLLERNFLQGEGDA